MRLPRRTRLLAVFLTVLALGVVGAALTLQLGAPALVRSAITSELAARGLSEARFEVEAAGWRHVSLREVHLGPDLEIDALELTTDASGLLGGRFESVTIVGAQWSTALDEDALRSSSLARLVSGSGEGGADESGMPRIALRRSRIVLERDGLAIPIELEGDVVLADARASLTLRSALGEHTLEIRARGDVRELRIDASLRSRAGGRAELSIRRPPGEDAPIAWTLAARFPAELAKRLAPELSLRGRADLAASGLVRPSAGSGWTLEHVALTAKLDDARAPAAELALENVRAALHLRARMHDGALVIDVDDHSQVHVGVATLSDWRAEQLALGPRLRVDVDDGAVRVRMREPIAARMRALAVGDGRGALRAERVSFTVGAHRARPLLEHGGRTTRAALRLTAESPRLVGALRGRELRARGHLVAELREGGARVSMPLRVDLARVLEPQSELALTGAHLDLTIATRGRPGLRADGRMRAERISWRGHALGAIGGAVSIADDRVALDWRGPLFGLGASIGLVRGDGRADIDVPWAVLRNGDPMHRLLADLTATKITGHASGQVHVDLRAPGAARAQLSVHDATIERTEDRTRARGVYGTIRLAGVEPVESAADDLVRWRELRLDDAITLGPGSARVRFERSGEIALRDAVARLEGGHVRAGPLRFDPDAPDLTLDLSFERVDIQRLVRAITRGRASGTGRVDGRIALRVRLGDEPRLVLGSGRLAARGGGRIRIEGGRDAAAARAPVELARLGNGEWLEDRVVSALRDFRYSRLVLDVVGAEGTKRVVARVSGRGAQTPQAIDLTLNVRGVQPVVDEVLRLWPSNLVSSP